MAERIAYLERLLWGGKRDKRVAQGPTLFDAFFNEAADAREAAIAETVQEIRKEAEKRRAFAGGRSRSVRNVICTRDFRKNGVRNIPRTSICRNMTLSARMWNVSSTALPPVCGWSVWNGNYSADVTL